MPTLTHQSCWAGGGCDPDQAGGDVAAQLQGLRVLQGEPDTLRCSSVPLVQQHHCNNIIRCENVKIVELSSLHMLVSPQVQPSNKKMQTPCSGWSNMVLAQ